MTTTGTKRTDQTWLASWVDTYKPTKLSVPWTQDRRGVFVQNAVNRVIHENLPREQEHRTSVRGKHRHVSGFYSPRASSHVVENTGVVRESSLGTIRCHCSVRHHDSPQWQSRKVLVDHILTPATQPSLYSRECHSQFMQLSLVRCTFIHFSVYK